MLEILGVNFGTVFLKDNSTILEVPVLESNTIGNLNPYFLSPNLIVKFFELK